MSLPKDVFVEIIRFADDSSIRSLCLVSKSMRQLISNNLCCVGEEIILPYTLITSNSYPSGQIFKVDIDSDWLSLADTIGHNSSNSNKHISLRMMMSCRYKHRWVTTYSVVMKAKEFMNSFLLAKEGASGYKLTFSLGDGFITIDEKGLIYRVNDSIILPLLKVIPSPHHLTVPLDGGAIKYILSKKSITHLTVTSWSVSHLIRVIRDCPNITHYSYIDSYKGYFAYISDMGIVCDRIEDGDLNVKHIKQFMPISVHHSIMEEPIDTYFSNLERPIHVLRNSSDY